MKKTSVINAKIKRLNITSEYTKPIFELQEAKKVIIDRTINYIDNEEPVFCFFDNVEYWWVITNLRIIVHENNDSFFFFFDEIISMKLDDIFKNGIKKEECDNIDLELKNGEHIKLYVEKGTWYGVYNVIKFLISP